MSEDMHGYLELFETGQYGKLYLSGGTHADGSYFHVQVLPEGETAIDCGPRNRCSNKNAVEVFGALPSPEPRYGGYAWLHRGPWEKDFEALVETARAKRDAAIVLAETERAEGLREESERVNKLLAAY